MDSINNENMSPVRSAKATKRLPPQSPFSSVTPSRRRPLKQSKQHPADPNLEATLNESKFDVSCLSAVESEADKTIAMDIESEECLDLLNKTEMEEKPYEKGLVTHSEEALRIVNEASKDVSLNLTLGIFEEGETDRNDSRSDPDEVVDESGVNNVESKEPVDVLNEPETEENHFEVKNFEASSTFNACNDVSFNLTLGIFQNEEADRTIAENLEGEDLDLLNKTEAEEKPSEADTVDQLISTSVEVETDTINESSPTLELDQDEEGGAARNESILHSNEVADGTIAGSTESQECLDALDGKTSQEKSEDVSFNLTLGIFKEDEASQSRNFLDSNEAGDENQEPIENLITPANETIQDKSVKQTEEIVDEEEYSESGRSFIEAKEEQKQDEKSPSSNGLADLGCDDTMALFEGKNLARENESQQTISNPMEEAETNPGNDIALNLTMEMFKEDENSFMAVSVQNVEVTEEKEEEPAETTFTEGVQICPVTGQLLTESLLEYEQIEKECLAEATFHAIMEEDETDLDEKQDSNVEINKNRTEERLETEVISSLLSISDKVETLTMSIEGSSVVDDKSEIPSIASAQKQRVIATNQEAKIEFSSLADELSALNVTVGTEFEKQPLATVDEVRSTLLEAQLNEVKEELARKTTQLEEQTIRALSDQVAAKVAADMSLEVSLSTANDALEKKVAELEETREKLTDAEMRASLWSQVDGELRDCKALLAAKDGQLGEASSQLEVIQNELSDLKLKASASDVLEEELSAAKKLLEAKSSEFEEMLAEKNTIKDELIAMEESAAGKLRETQLELQEKEGRNEKMSSELGSLAEQLSATLIQKTSLESQLEELRKDLQERNIKLEEFSEQSASLQSDLNEAREMIAHLGNDKDGLVTYSQQVEDLANQMDQLKNEISAKGSVITSLEDSLNFANEALEKKVAELAETRNTLSDAEKKAYLWSQVDIDLRECQALLARKDCQLAEVSSQLEDNQNELSNLKLKASASDALEGELSAAKDLLETKSSQLEEMFAEKNSIKTELIILEENKTMLENQLEDLKKDLLERKIQFEEFSAQSTSLQSELSDAKEIIAHLESARAELTETKDVLKTKSQQVLDLTAQTEQLEKEVSTKGSWIISLEASLNMSNESLEKKVVELAETRDKLNDAEIKASMLSELDVELRDCKALLAAKDSQLGEASSQLEVIQNELSDLKLKAAASDVLEKELSAAKNLLQSKSLQFEEMLAEKNTIKAELIAMEENAAGRLKEAQLELQKKERRNEKMSSELSSLAEQLSVTLNQKTSLETELEESRKDVFERKIQFEEVSAQSASLTCELNEARKTIAHLDCGQIELAETKDGLRIKTQQMSDLTAQMEELKNELSAKRVLCSSFEDSVNTMQKQTEELRRKEEELDAKADALLRTETQLKSVNENMGLLSAQLEEATNKLNETREQLSKVQEKASSVVSLELHNKSLLDEKEKLQAEVEKLGKFLDESEENEQVLTARINEYELKLRDREYGSTPGLLGALKEGGLEVSRDISIKTDDADSDNEAKFKSASSSPTKADNVLEDSADESPLRANSTLGPSFYKRIHEAPKTPGTPNKKANDSVCKQQ